MGPEITSLSVASSAVRSPMSQNPMRRDGGSMVARCLHQLAELQGHDRALHCAFGKPGFIGEHAQAGFDRLPALTGGAAGKKKVNEKCRWLLIVTDDITHQDIEDVVVYRNSLAKTRHEDENLKQPHPYKVRQLFTAIPIRGQRFSQSHSPSSWTFPK